jgi:hypothetical protein
MLIFLPSVPWNVFGFADVLLLPSDLFWSFLELNFYFGLCTWKNISALFMMLENSVLVPKEEEVTGGWRNLHDEDRQNLYSPPEINADGQ